jgi:translation initiation factor 2 alpha subunit (eIF-2alpha)
MFLYKNIKPSINDIVLARITEINKFNIVASLIEYDNLVAYISHVELSKKRRYKINKIVHVGKEVIAQVTGFNTGKNYAELSIRVVNETDIENFNKMHRTSITLYNLWRYIYMKLNPELNMDVDKINPNDINDFMNKTLWKIKESLQEDINNETENNENDEDEVEDDTHNENSNLDELYNNLINHSKNTELLKYIEYYDPILIKNILDSYALTKIVLVKQSNYKEFNICSYNVDGLSDIKLALDYKSYDKYLELDEKYDIAILYLSGGKYSLTVKQKTPIEEDITDTCNYLFEEIKSRCEANNVIFSIVI